MNNNDKNNNYVEERVKDFLTGLYNLCSDESGNKNNDKTQTVSCGIKEAENFKRYESENERTSYGYYTNRLDYKFIKDMISGNFDYQKYESENVLLVKPHRKSLDVGGSDEKDSEYGHLLYGNIDNIIKYGDANYKKLVAVFEKAVANNNKSWVNDVNNFVKQGKEKNGMFSQDLNGQKFFMTDCDIEYNKDNKKIKEVVVYNWERDYDASATRTRPATDWIKEKYKDSIYLTDKFTINWQPDLAIADFLLDVIKARYDQGIKITTEEILKLSENISDKDIQTKFKICSLNFLFEHVEKPKESNLDITFGLEDEDVYRLYKTPAQQKQKYLKELFGNDDKDTKFLAINWLYSWPEIKTRYGGHYGMDVTKPICADNERFKNLIIRHVKNRTFNENHFRDKLNEEEADLYKDSFIDMKFVFDFLDTGKLDKTKEPWEFDDRCRELFNFLKDIPTEATIKFDPDKLNQDQKYLLITSMLDGCSGFINRYNKNQFIFDTLDFEKYKLEPETKKMINAYFEKNIKLKIDEELKSVNEYQNNMKEQLNKYSKELEEVNEKNETSKNTISNLEKQKKSINQFLAKQKTFEDYIKNETANALESGNTDNFKLENLLFDAADSVTTDEKSNVKDLFTKMANDLKTKLNSLVRELSNLSSEITNLKLKKDLKQIKDEESKQKIKSLNYKKTDVENKIKSGESKNLGSASLWPALLTFPLLPISIFLFVRYLKVKQAQKDHENDMSKLKEEKEAIETKLSELKKNKTEIKNTEAELESLDIAIKGKELKRTNFVNNGCNVMMQEFNNHIKTFNSKSNRLVKDIDAENRSIDYGFYKIGKLKVEVKDYEDQIKINEAEINRYNLFLKKISDGLDIKQEKVKPLERRNTSIENYKNQQKEKEAKNQNQKNQFEH